MIIATIGSQSFIIESIQDAEHLLKIFGKATPVDDSYDSEYKGYFYPDNNCDVRIDISSKELVTLDEHRRRRADRDERDTARREAAQATTSTTAPD